MSCEDKGEKIICETCKCSYDKDNKLRVECINCSDNNDMTIICEACNYIENDENDKKEVCLKKCIIGGVLEDTIYITCTKYDEDLD